MRTDEMSPYVRVYKKIGTEEATCPNCKKSLEKIPKRKAKCPYCDKYIFVRTRPADRKRVLLTETQAQEIQAQWHEYIQIPSPRIWEMDGYDAEKERLRTILTAEPSINDVLLSLLIKNTQEYSKKKLCGLYRNSLLSIGEILRSESKFDDALNVYLQVCYLDINGPLNSGNGFHPKGGELLPLILYIVGYIVGYLEIDSRMLREKFIIAARDVDKKGNPPINPVTAWRYFESNFYI